MPPPRPKRKASKPYPRKAETSGADGVGNLEGMVTQVGLHCPAWPAWHNSNGCSDCKLSVQAVMHRQACIVIRACLAWTK